MTSGTGKTLILVSSGVRRAWVAQKLLELPAGASSDIWVPESEADFYRRKLEPRCSLTVYPDEGLRVSAIPRGYSQCVLFLKPPWGGRCRRLRWAALRCGARRFTVLTSPLQTACTVGRLGLLLNGLLAECADVLVPSLAKLFLAIQLWRARGTARRPAAPEIRSVAFLIGTLGMGGAERQLLALATGLKRQDVEVHLLLFSPEDDFFKERAERAGLTLWDVREYDELPDGTKRWARMFETTPEWCELGKVLRIAAWLKQHPVDVFNPMMDQPNFIGGLAGRLAGVPLICGGLRSSSPKDYAGPTLPTLRRWYRRTLWAFDGFIANSHRGADGFAAWAEYERSRICVVPNGIDATTFTPAQDEEVAHVRAELNLAPDLPVLVFAGRLTWEKRVEDYLECCRILKAQGRTFQALVAGGGPQQDALKHRAQELGLDDCVRFLGPRKDVAALYRLARVVMLTSSVEGFPNAVLEAQWSGMPVVSTDAGDVRRIIEEGVTGFIVPVGDMEAAAKHVARLIDDTDLARRMGKAGSLRVRKLFPVERLVEQTLEVYRCLTERRSLTEAAR